MDSSRFDALVRSWQWGSRRDSLRWLAVGALSGVVTRLGTDEAAAKKKKKRKKKQQSPASPSPQCVPNCIGKSCGDANGCGGTCTACPSGQACQGSRCVANDCDQPCLGGHVCENGSCVCPPGLQECDQNWCGECCSRADCPGFPDPRGQYCIADGNKAMYCGCLGSQEVTCGDGLCVLCCDSIRCIDRFGPNRVCINGGCACAPGYSLCSGLCVDPQRDRHHCGEDCRDCGNSLDCVDGKCCVPPGGCDGATAGYNYPCCGELGKTCQAIDITTFVCT